MVCHCSGLTTVGSSTFIGAVGFPMYMYRSIPMLGLRPWGLVYICGTSIKSLLSGDSTVGSCVVGVSIVGCSIVLLPQRGMNYCSKGLYRGASTKVLFSLHLGGINQHRIVCFILNTVVNVEINYLLQ